MSRPAFTGQYIEPTSIVTHVLSDQIVLVNEIDDILTLNICIDGARTITALTGWTEVHNVSSGGIRHIFAWRRATAQNETLPDIVLSAADSVSVECIVMVGCPTGSTPIGNQTANTGNDAVPVWNSIAYSTFSCILYCGAMDVDTLLTVGELEVLEAADATSNTGIVATSVDESAGSTGIINGTASAVDGWQTLTIEFYDDGSEFMRTYLDQLPSEDIPTTDYTIDDGTFRNLLMGRLIDTDTGRTQLTYDFDGNTDVDTALDQITLAVVDAAHKRIFRINDNGNTVPVGLLNNSYYYLKKVDATTVELKVCDALDIPYNENRTSTVLFTPTDITAVGSGTITLEESGIMLQSRGTDQDYDRFLSYHHSEQNYWGSAIKFNTPRDMTDEVMAFAKLQTSTNIIDDCFYVSFDSSGNWKSWRQLDINRVPIEIQSLIDIDNNTVTHQTEGTFDPSAVEYLVMLYKVRASTSRCTLKWGNPYILKTVIPLGGDTTIGISFELYMTLVQKFIEGTTGFSGFQYQMLHNLQIGNGTKRAIFSDAGISLLFPPLSDGITTFDAYLVDLGVTIYQSDDDDLTLNTAQIGAGAPFGFTVHVSSSITAGLDLAGVQLLQGTVTLKAGISIESQLWFGGEGIFSNGANLNNITIDAVDRAAGAIVIDVADGGTIENVIFKNNTYDIQIDGTGSITLKNYTYTNTVTANLNPTLTSGILNITIDGGDTPTLDGTWTDQGGGEWTKGSATVNLLVPLTTLNFLRANIINGSRFQIKNNTQATELTNALVSGGGGIDETYTIGIDYDAGDIGSYKITYQSGVTAKETITGIFEFPAITAENASPEIQVDHAMYVLHNTDGSGITGLTWNGGNIDINRTGNLLSIQDLAAWYFAEITTAVGIDELAGGIVWERLNDVLVDNDIVDMLIKNTKSTPALLLVGGWMHRVDEDTIIEADSYSIQMYYDPVYVKETGVSGLTAPESTQLFALGTPAEVWAYTTRTLSSFGSLVADVATAVWAAGTRTLTSFGTLIADIWTNVTRTLTAGTKDTEIDAIQAKTDNLPTDPADQSLVEAAIAASEGNIRGGVDTLDSLSDQIDAIPTTPMRGTDNAALASALVTHNDNLGVVDGKIDLIPTTPMRGTDGANITVPDVAGTAATLHGITDGKIDSQQIDVTYLRYIVDNKRELRKVGDVWQLVVWNEAETPGNEIMIKEQKDKDGNDITDLEAGELASELKNSV